jgi:hypothetical protein
MTVLDGRWHVYAGRALEEPIEIQVESQVTAALHAHDFDAWAAFLAIIQKVLENSES